MNKKCVKLYYNWRQCGDGNEWGEDYDIHEVGRNGVIDICIEHNMGCWIVDYDDGKRELIYNPNQAFFIKA